MDDSTLAERVRQLQTDQPDRYASVALFAYTCIVYVWSLSIPPLGADFARLAGATSNPWDGLARLQATVFGSWSLFYHLSNLLLFYLCARFVYLIGRRIIAGPAWISLLAAVVYMANPVQQDAVFPHTAIVHLVPGLLTLAGLWAYVVLRANQSRMPKPVYVLVLAVGLLVEPALALAVGLGELLLPKENRLPVAVTSAAIVVAGLAVALRFWLEIPADRFWTVDPAAMWAPLYLPLYPIGFLPETIRRFHEAPWLAWLSVAIAVTGVAFIAWKARSRVFIFAILAALALRIGHADQAVDLVNMEGTGALLAANALVLLAVCELFYRMARHPKWLKHVVTATTLWCMVLFGMQIHGAFVWRNTGRLIASFQQRTLEAATNTPRLGILPNIAHYRRVPAHFSESVQYDTPFTTALDVEVLSTLNVWDPEAFEVTAPTNDETDTLLMVRADKPGYVLGFPYTYAGRDVSTTHYTPTGEVAWRTELQAKPDDRGEVVLEVRLVEGSPPPTIVAALADL